MRTVHPRARHFVLSIVLAVASPAVVALIPPLLGFVVAFAAATGWCWWLEQHPER